MSRRRFRRRVAYCLVFVEAGVRSRRLVPCASCDDRLPAAAAAAQRMRSPDQGCRRRIPGGKGYERQGTLIMQGGIEREIAGELPFSATFVGGDNVAAS